MTDHTCSYYCLRPECVLRQRAELRDMFVVSDAVPGIADLDDVNIHEPHSEKCRCNGDARTDRCCREWKGACQCCTPAVCQRCGHDRACHKEASK